MLKNIYLWTFLSTLQISTTSYFLLDYFKSINIKNEEASLILICTSVVSFFFYISIIKIFKKISLKKTVLLSLIISIILQLIWAFNHISILIITTYILSPVFFIPFLIVIDILMEKYTPNENETGKFRGILLTIMSIAFALGPLLSGLLIKYSISYMWLFGAFLIFIFLLSFIKTYPKIKKLKYKNNNPLSAIKEIKNNIHLKYIFIINFFLYFFFSVMVFYSAYYLKNFLNIPFNKIGLIFSIILLPFIFFSLPLGKIADKYIGEKELLFLGFAIVIISTFIFGFYQTQNIWIITTILLFTRIGGAIIQPMIETYFFKFVNEINTQTISLFRTIPSLSSIIAPLFSIIILLFLPYNWIFILLSIFILPVFYFIYKLKDTK